jgi:integrase
METTVLHAMITNEILRAETVNGNAEGTFPIKIRRGGIEVKIYHRREKGRYDCFTVAYYARGKRELKPFSTLEAAKAEAQDVLQRLVQGEPEVVSLTGGDRLAFLRAKSQLEPTQVPIDVAVAEYVHLLALLNGKATPTEAVRTFISRMSNAPAPKRVEAVVTELITTRKAQNSSPRHVQDLKYRLTIFADSFHCNIADISAADINRWLLSLKLAPRSINNFRTALSNLYGFARQQKYVQRDCNPMENVSEVIEAQKKVGIYAPTELAAMLTSCPVDFLPFLVLAAFGGLRSSEIERLAWENIGVDEIEVPPSGFRVKSTRLFKMHPTLKTWLKVLRKPGGPVVVYKNVSNKIHGVTLKAGVTPRPNALRHSFASYSLALDGNPEALAYKMGNSRSMLNKHYRRLIGAKEARAWFALTPRKLKITMSVQVAKPAVGEFKILDAAA